MSLAVLLFCVNRNDTTWSALRTKESLCERLIAKLRDGDPYTRAVAVYAADGQPVALGKCRTQSQVEETTHD